MSHKERRRIAPPCTIEGCNRPTEYLRAGLCEMHMLRLRKHGSLEKPKHPRLGNGKYHNSDGTRMQCKADGCTKDAKLRGIGYCTAHEHRLRRYGNPLHDPIAAKRRPCKEDGCDTPTTAKHGLCTKHARRFYAQREKGTKKRQARIDVGNALATGKLTRQPCEVCGNENSQAHHPDYDKPLNVMWLCPTHHAQEHKRTK